MIAAATSQSYGLTAADINWRLRVVVTATNDKGTASATSAPTALVTASTPAATSTTTTTTPTTTTTTTPTVSTTTTTTTTTTTGSTSAAKPPSPPAGATVTSLTLVNADTGTDIKTLAEGDTLDLGKLPTRNLNIRANVSSKTASVRFGLDGTTNFRTEGTPPFAMAGDQSGHYYAWSPSIGSHRIVATPFSSGGTSGTLLALDLTVTSTAPSLPPAPAPAPAPTPTPAPAPAPAPSSTGSVLFRADFESGTLNPWADIQCANFGTAGSSEFTRGNVFAVTGLGGQGTYSSRIDLPAAATKSVCEMGKGAAHPIGSDDYYSVAVRFPSDWVEPGGWGLTFAQLGFQYPPVWGGPLSLTAHKDSVEVVVQGGSCGYGTGCTRSIHQNIVPAGSLATGVWHQFIVHSHWATDTTGLTEVWWKTSGSATWTKTATLSGGPTVEWAPGTNPTAPNLDKIGAYRGASSVPLSIWLDGFCRATSFDAAASCL